MTAGVAIVGYGRTPLSRAKADERIYTVDESVAWAADLASKKAGMPKNDFDDQGFGQDRLTIPSRCFLAMS